MGEAHLRAWGRLQGVAAKTFFPWVEKGRACPKRNDTRAVLLTLKNILLGFMLRELSDRSTGLLDRECPLNPLPDTHQEERPAS